MKSIITIVIIVAIALIAYFYYEGSAPSASNSLLSASAAPASGDIGKQVLNLLSQIQSLRIDSTLFSDPGFQTLRDFSVAIPPQNVGRANPFAPLPGAPVSPAAAH
jgi:hypothetical protein